MRNAVGIFGGLAGAIVVALVARYGFATSDTRLDGAIAAFFFAVIAIGGIGGPAVAVNLFRSAEGWASTWGVVAGIIATVALLANLSNSLGAIAGRADRTLAERTSAKDARKDARDALTSATKARDALPAFTPATADDVAAAREAVAAAQRSTSAECGNGTNPKQRGNHCREREGDEKTKRDALGTALANKALTDRAGKLDADAATAQRKLETSPPVASVNPMAETLARIFHMQADDAATWQQVATVIVVELLIAFALIAYELLGVERKSLETREAAAVTSTPAASQQPTEPETPPPDTATGDVASVGRFMLACLPRVEGEEASWGAIYARYKRWCAEHAQPIAPLDLAEFGQQFGEVCRRVGIRTRSTRKTAYCLDVRLAA